MLRRRADRSRDDSVWVDGRHCVANGDIVQVLRQDADGEQGFSLIRTAHNHEGFIRSQLLQLRPPPTKGAVDTFMLQGSSRLMAIARQADDLPKIFEAVKTANSQFSDPIFESSPASIGQHSKLSDRVSGWLPTHVLAASNREKLGAAASSSLL